jgi:hypothetical protein
LGLVGVALDFVETHVVFAVAGGGEVAWHIGGMGWVCDVCGCIAFYRRLLLDGWLCILVERWESERRYEAKGYLYVCILIRTQSQFEGPTGGTCSVRHGRSLIARRVDMRAMSAANWVSHWRTSPSRTEQALRTRPPALLLHAADGSAPNH